MSRTTTKTKRPASPAALTANRANATHSTGPRTPEGKARSAQNSRRHGFSTACFNVIRLEDLHEVAHLRADLIAVYQPANSQEAFALERMAVAQQTIRRAARLEAGLFTNCLNEALNVATDEPFLPMNQQLAGDGDIEIARAQNRNFLLAEGFHRVTRQSNAWPLFLRYQAQAERLYRRALEDFDRLKALRGELPNEPISDPEPEENPDPYVQSESNPFQTQNTAPPQPQPAPPPSPAPQSAARCRRAPRRHLQPLQLPVTMERSLTVGVAQLGRAPDCGSGGRGFESLHPPHPSPAQHLPRSPRPLTSPATRPPQFLPRCAVQFQKTLVPDETYPHSRCTIAQYSHLCSARVIPKTPCRWA